MRRLATKASEYAADVHECQHANLETPVRAFNDAIIGYACANCGRPTRQVAPVKPKRKQPKIVSLPLKGVKL